MHVTLNGSHVVAVQRHAAPLANRKAPRVAVVTVVAQAVVKAEPQVVVKVTGPLVQVPEQVAAVARAELITAAQAASSARPAARRAPSHLQARQAPVHAAAARRVDRA